MKKITPKDIIDFILSGNFILLLLLLFHFFVTIANISLFIHAFITGGWTGFVEYWNVWSNGMIK